MVLDLDRRLINLAVVVLTLALLQGVLVIAVVPSGHFAPERNVLEQIAALDEGRPVDGLYPRLAYAGLQRVSPELPDGYVYVLRLTSLTFALAVLAAIFLLVAGLFPAKPYLAPGSMLVLLLTPAFALAAAQATPEMLVALLVTLILAAAGWMLHRGVSLLTLGSVTALVVLGVQSDWGFWWLVPVVLLTVVLTMVLPAGDQTHWLAQMAVIAGIGVALVGGVIALQSSDQLLPVLTRTIERFNEILTKAAVPTPAALLDLFRRYWTGPIALSRLWYGALLLWVAIGLYGLWRYVASIHVRALSLRRQIHFGLGLAFGGSILLGAVFVPGSVATWPAPMLVFGAPLLALGWSHVASARVRPQWLLLGLLGLGLLNVAALL